GEGEDPRADDAADADRGELPEAEVPFQAVLATGLVVDRVDRLPSEEGACRRRHAPTLLLVGALCAVGLPRGARGWAGPSFAVSDSSRARCPVNCRWARNSGGDGGNRRGGGTPRLQAG